ncbi:hypothetical protein RhiirA5_446972 [Rhizophagus irregularis]|uniref:Uncharacterized protein n=1 Tax=Rhizophagus irregularis TaxID=588596 RepID=A0A2N0NBE8_9GLOM|nr:hypothetical protein RhiirA5_446972 [Rhizophagus irregularis]
MEAGTSLTIALMSQTHQATRADIWPHSFLAAGISHAQHIIAARICLPAGFSYVLDRLIPSYNSINWSITGAK